MKMVKINKFVSLLVVLVMLVAAAITVNKVVFGHNIQAEQSPEAEEAAVETDEFITVDANGNHIIHTKGMQGTVIGYAGPVPLDIYIADGKIAKIEPQNNVETPSFFNRTTSLFSNWIGKTPAEALEMKVDGISGATYSSEAIISNVNAGLAYYEGVKARKTTSTPWKIWVALAVTLAACIVPLFVKNKIYHTAQLIANVAVLGFWCGQFLDYAMMLKCISSGFVLPAGLVAIAMLVAAFIYPLFGHPQHYCTHICPLGSAQQLVAQVCGYKLHLSKKVIKGLDWFRKILWAALMLLLWADCLTGWMDFELFQAFQVQSASWWIIGAALFFVALSAVVTRPYCRFVCPTGSLFKRAENHG